MATSKFHVVFSVWLFFALFFTLNESHTAVAEAVVKSDNCDALRIEVDKLISKIQSLESVIDKINQELKSRDETIAQYEKTIKEKSNYVTSFQSEVAKYASYADSYWKQLGNPAFQFILQKVFIIQSQAEKWAEPHVQTIKTSYAGSHWKEHGKFAFESFMQKAWEKKAQAEKWAEPHVETIKTKWVPAALEQSRLVITNAEPYVRSLVKNIKYVSIQSLDFLTQQLVRITRKINAFLQA